MFFEGYVIPTLILLVVYLAIIFQFRYRMTDLAMDSVRAEQKRITILVGVSTKHRTA